MAGTRADAAGGAARSGQAVRRRGERADGVARSRASRRGASGPVAGGPRGGAGAGLAAGAGPDVAAGLTIDLDATVTVAHSEKENAAATWKKTYGLRFRAGRPRPGCPGKAGSNTGADHVSVLDMALAALPPRARPRPGDPACAAVLIRADAAGATHMFAAAVRERGCSFSLGFAIDVQDAVLRVPARAWTRPMTSTASPATARRS